MKQLALAVVAMCSLTGIAAADKAVPPPIEARIVAVQMTSSDMTVTVAAGSDQGVEKTHRCGFYDAKKVPVAGSCMIVRIDKKLTVVKTNLAVNQVKGLIVKLGVYL